MRCDLPVKRPFLDWCARQACRLGRCQQTAEQVASACLVVVEAGQNERAASVHALLHAVPLARSQRAAGGKATHRSARQRLTRAYARPPYSNLPDLGYRFVAFDLDHSRSKARLACFRCSTAGARRRPLRPTPPHPYQIHFVVALILLCCLTGVGGRSGPAARAGARAVAPPAGGGEPPLCAAMRAAGTEAAATWVKPAAYAALNIVTASVSGRHGQRNLLSMLIQRKQQRCAMHCMPAMRCLLHVGWNEHACSPDSMQGATRPGTFLNRSCPPSLGRCHPLSQHLRT